jgi:hypothetical protein
MARNFLGFDQRGMLGFDLGDGGPPAWLPVTPDTASEAMRLEAAAGRDPAAVLRRQGGASLTAPTGMVAPPPAPGAMGPTALAKGPSMVIDVGPKPPSMILDVAPAPGPAPLPAIPAGAPIALAPEEPGARRAFRIESGPGDVSAGKAAGWSQTKIDYETKKQEVAPAAPATAPGLSAGNPTSGLVPTPGGARGEAGGSRQPPPGMNAQEYQNWLRSEIAAEAGRRPSAGTLVKGGKMQTGEQWQGAVGPNADTVEAMRANAQGAGRLQRIQADALNERDLAAAKIAGEQADYETKAAEVQAQIAQRKQAALEGIGAQAQALQQKIASAEIDDGRWWGSKSAADKATIGIAVALDGIVRGLTGRPGQPNAVLQEVYRQQDRDLDMQIKGVEKQKGDLNDLQRIYVQTKEQYGDEALAADAAKLAGLVGFKAKIQAEAAKADAVQATDPVFKKQQLQEMAEAEQAIAVALGADSEDAKRAAEARIQKLAARTRSYSVRGKLLELDVDRRVLEQQAAIEERMNGTLAKSYGFTQDRVVGGSGGADRKKIRGLFKELNDVEGEQRKLTVSEREAAAKVKAGQADLRLPGGSMAVREGIPESLYNELAKKIVIADQYDAGLEEMVKRAKQPGGLTPGDPALKVFSDQAATLGSQLNWAGQPNTFQEELVIEASKPGPRQDAAIEALRGQSRALRSAVTKQLGR